MKLGLMQPYLFPYIGYFQLISAVDLFIIADDVQWISGGWINRNRVLVQGQIRYLTLPLHKNSRRANINTYELAQNAGAEKTKILRRLKGSYSNAPHFEEVYNLVERCFACEDHKVSKFVTNSIAECCQYLNLKPSIQYSSELDVSGDLKAQDRVIEINRLLNSDHYINPIGGVELYSKERFSDVNLQLNFLKSRPVEYAQSKNDFVPDLSIIDVLMHNSVDQVTEMLSQYDLV